MGYGDVGGNRSVRWEMHVHGDDGPKDRTSDDTQSGGAQQTGGDDTPRRGWNDGFVVSIRLPKINLPNGQPPTAANFINFIAANLVNGPGRDAGRRVQFPLPIEDDNDENNFDQVSVRWGRHRDVPREDRPPDPPVRAVPLRGSVGVAVTRRTASPRKRAKGKSKGGGAAKGTTKRAGTSKAGVQRRKRRPKRR